MQILLSIYLNKLFFYKSKIFFNILQNLQNNQKQFKDFLF